MKKLLKTLACSAVAALVGASAFADYGWYDGAMTIGGVNTDFMTWSTDVDHPTDLGDCTDMTITGIDFNVWSDANDRGGANMYFRIWDGGSSPVGDDQDLWLGLSTRSAGDHDFAISWSGTENLASAVGLTLEHGKEYYIDMWAKTYGDSGDEWYSAGGANFHAKLTYRNPQTVTFELNGGDSCPVTTVVCPIGGLYTGFAPAVWEHHIFRGWWTDPTDGTRVKTNETVSADSTLTLYAHWQACQTVYFDGNGGTPSKPSKMCPHGSTYEGLASATRDNYRFMGWYDDPTDGTRIKSGVAVTAPDTRMVYAHWAAEQTVYFDGNGGTPSKASKACLVGGTYSGFASATWENHRFLGWYDDPTDGDRVKSGMTVTGDSTRTLYAHWSAEQTVYFDGNGGTPSKPSKGCLIGGTYSGFASATWDGHVFRGWYDDPTEGERVKGGMPVTEATSRTLYAHWKESASASQSAITGFSFAPRVKAGARAVTTDTLTRDTTGVTGNSYTDWSGKTGASGAVYAGQSAGGNSSIQLRSKNSNSGIITTTSGGTAKKVTVEWNSSTTTGNKLNIYGKGSAYDAASDLYGADAGTSLGSIVMGTSTALDITGEYEYIGMRSDNGALYLTSVSIQWDNGASPPPSEPTVTLEASATEVEIGDVVTVTATAENFSGDVTWEWAGDGTDAGNVFTVDTSVAGDHLIMVEASYGDESAEAEVTITVIAPPPPSVTLEASATEVEIGGVVTVTATANNFSGDVTWTWAGDGTAAGNVFTVDTSVAGDHLIMVEATCGDETADAEVTITVSEPVVVTGDELTNDDVGSQSSNYGNWTATKASGAEYAGQTAGGSSTNPCIQLRSSNNNSGIVMTKSSEKNVSVVTIVWNSQCAADRVLDVYGSTTAYTSPSQLYSAATQGTFLGSVTNGQDGVTVDVAAVGEYPFVGIRSHSGAIYLTSVTVSFDSAPGAFSITLDPASAFSVEQNASATITATPHNATEGAVNYGWAIDSEPVAGVIGNELSLSTSTVGGPHTVTSTATDDSGAEATASVSYTVIAPPEKYVRITSMNAMQDGEFVITGAGTGSEYAMKNTSSGSTVVIDRREDAVTIADDAVTDADASILWTLTKNEDGQWTIYNSTAGYVGYLDSGKNSANFASTESDQTRWTIAESGNDDGLFLLTNVGDSDRMLLYNASSPRFACYASIGNQKLLSLYRKKVPRQRIDFDVNGEGASCPVAWLELDVGGVYTNFLPATREHNIFRGWWTDPMEGTRVQMGQTVTSDSTLQLYAHWQACQTVYFDGNGGTPSKESKLCPHGSTYEGLATATRDNYRFMGWYDDPTGGERIKSGVPVTDSDTRTVYAHWEGEQTVYFDGNGGTPSKPSKTCLLDGTYSGFASATRDNYRFMGWYDDPTDGERVTSGMAVTGGYMRTLYAHWSGEQMVYFDGNGGMPSKSSKGCLLGGTYSGFASATRDGYNFLGWYDDPTDGERVKSGMAVTEATSRTLYAHWKESASASQASITAYSFAPRATSPGVRSVAADSIECTLWVLTTANCSYEVQWTESLNGKWTVLKHWIADEDAEIPVTVVAPSTSTGFFRFVEVNED